MRNHASFFLRAAVLRAAVLRRAVLRAAALLALCVPPAATAADLVSGPMVGPVEMREAQIWVRTDGPATVRVRYREEGNDGAAHETAPVTTEARNGFTAAATLDKVEPGKNYRYNVRLDGETTSGKGAFATPAFYHHRAEPPDLRIAVGGGHYAVEEAFDHPYKTLGKGYGIFSEIHDADPDLMLWVGNTAHLRVTDEGSLSGRMKRFTTARNVAELQPLLRDTPHYATWGPSDFGHGAVPGRQYSYRGQAETSFSAFWPRPVSIPALDGVATRFRRADVDFFLLDVHSRRDDTPSSEKTIEILGRKQIEWLRKELAHSDATFKIIAAGAPILNPAKSDGHLSKADREHTRLLRMLREENISGLFFLSGGKAYGELTRTVHASTYRYHDLTLGPLTAQPEKRQKDLNYFRAPGSSVAERHFALLDITGPEDDRRLTVRVLDTNGEAIWDRTIKAAELNAEN